MDLIALEEVRKLSQAYRKRLYIGFGLFGIDAKNIKPKKMYELALCWMNQFNLHPNLLFTNHARLIKKFNSSDKSIRENNFKGLKYFIITKIPDDIFQKCGINNQYGIDCEIHLYKYGNNYIFSIFYAYELVKNRLAEIFQLLKDFCEIGKPRQGYGTIRDDRDGFSKHVSGLQLYSREDDPGAGDENTWLDIVDRAGSNQYIRNIHRWNFFTEAQLTRKIDSMTVRDWILTDSSRGTLELFSQDIFLYTVPESSVSRIRKLFWENDIIFNRRTTLDAFSIKYNCGYEEWLEYLKNDTIPNDQLPKVYPPGTKPLTPYFDSESSIAESDRETKQKLQPKKASKPTAEDE